MMKRLFFLLSFLASFAFADLPIYISGSGVKSDATNAVLEASIAYTDGATNAVVSSLLPEIVRSVTVSENYTDAATNALLNAFLSYADWEINSRMSSTGTLFYYPNSPTNLVLDSSIQVFQVSSDGHIKAQPMFEVYSPAETPVYVASNTYVEGSVYQLVFTCGTVGHPIDFKLIVTLMPYDGVVGTASKTIIFNLRRTF